MPRIIETRASNPYWRYFEKVNDSGEVIAEATVSILTGEMFIKKICFGLFLTEKTKHCDPDEIPYAVFSELG